MKVTLINFTDFNSIKTSKGKDSYFIAKELYKRELLDKIFMRGKDKNDLDSFIKVPLFGNLIPKAMSFYNAKINKEFPSRELSFIMLDKFVEKNITDNITLSTFRNERILLFGVPGFKETMLKAKQLCLKTAVIATSAHPNYVDKLMKDEYKKWGLEKPKVRSPKLNQMSVDTYNMADLILSRSEYTTKTLVKSGIDPNKIRFIGNGIDISRFSPNKNKDKKIFRVVYVAHTGLLKGLQYLLKAWEQFKNEENMELVICGNMDKEMDPILKKFNHKNVKFEGIVNPVEYYKKSNLYVLPSLTEGSPLTCVEAMACGIPIIVFENTGALIKDGEGGYILKNRDVQSLTNKIKYYYNNPNYCERDGEVARKIAEKWNWEYYANLVVDTLDNFFQD